MMTLLAKTIAFVFLAQSLNVQGFGLGDIGDLPGGDGDIEDLPGGDDPVDVVPLLPSVNIETTVYLGHDDGSSCSTATESVTGNFEDPVTYCLEVTNAGNSFLRVNIVDNDIGFSEEVDNLLAPGESIILPVERSIESDLTNLATVTAFPVLEDGTDIPNLADVTDADDANVVLLPTPASTVTIYGSAYVKIVFPRRSSPVSASDVNEVGAAVCHHIARFLTWVYHPNDVAVPDCTWDVRAQSHSQLRMIFRYTAVISGVGLSAKNAGLEIENAVEESFLEGDVRDELINDLHNLSDANPLSETTSVELDTESSSVAETPSEQRDSCSMVPEFLQSIPFLGAVLNTVMCFLFGPRGMIATLADLFV